MIIYVEDCEQSLISLCKIAPRMSHARNRWSFEAAPLFAASLAGIRNGRILREKEDSCDDLFIAAKHLLTEKKRSMHELNSPSGRSLVPHFAKHEATSAMQDDALLCN